ncbi:DUF4294 domain-containing protein [Marinilabiliaceae bacterium JC017]|nr:DUF4294 domain-containing protein [Marinilabiliaceae bacterium JC017]
MNAMTQEKKIDPEKAIYLEQKVIGTDTMPHINLHEIKIVTPWRFKNKRQHIRYSKLLRNIRITLPYARMASQKLNAINQHLSTMETEKERKAYLKKAEKELFKEFEKPLRKLTFSQGRLLIQLIDRETGDTSYNLIKEYKGGFSAFFWQSIARLFGSNLKSEYDAEGDDKMIEHIIIMIDNGML